MPKKSKPNLPRLLDGKYFKVLTQDFSPESSSIEAKCQTCLKVRKGDYRSTGNFMEHYKSCHKELVDELNAYRKQKECAPSSLKQTTLVQRFSPMTTEIVSNCFFLINLVVKDYIFANSFQLFTVLLRFIVDSNLPFSTIQQTSFSDLLNTVAGREVSLPSNTSFMNFLKNQFDDMRKRLRALLEKQKYICITTDVWSSKAQSYLGMTVHFINERFERESYVLSFRQLKHKQTYEVLTSEIVAVMKEYGIDVDKITHILTDGGSAFCKAFKVNFAIISVKIQNLLLFHFNLI